MTHPTPAVITLDLAADFKVFATVCLAIPVYTAITVFFPTVDATFFAA